MRSLNGFITPGPWPSTYCQSLIGSYSGISTYQSLIGSYTTVDQLVHTSLWLVHTTPGLVHTSFWLVHTAPGLVDTVSDGFIYPRLCPYIASHYSWLSAYQPMIGLHYSWLSTYQPLIGSPRAPIISSQCNCSFSPVLSRPILNQPISSFLRNFLQYTENTRVKPASSNSIAGK